MRRIVPLIAVLCLFGAPVARADKAAASVCAASLQPHARLVFDAVSAKPEPGSRLRELIEARVRELVFMDRLMVSAARPAAEAASPCLRLARNCIGDSC